MKLLLLLIFSISLVLTQGGWPTDDTPKSKSLPSLEVKVAPPEVYQPKVQAEIRRLDLIREEKEYKYLENLESKYNAELISSGSKIKGIVTSALKVFDDPALLRKSVQYAMNPPVLQRGSKDVVSFKEQGVQISLPQDGKENTVAGGKEIDLAQLQRLTRDELYAQDRSARMLRHDSFKKARFSERKEPAFDENKNTVAKSGPLSGPVEGPINSFEAMMDFDAAKLQPQVTSSDKAKNPQDAAKRDASDNGPSLAKTSSFLPPSAGDAEQGVTRNGPVLSEKEPADQEKSQDLQKPYADPPAINNLEESSKNRSDLPEEKSDNHRPGNGAVESPSENNMFGLYSSSFLETKESESSSQNSDSGPPLPPVMVKLYNSKDADAKIQTEIEKLEKERDGFESKMFLKAEKELMLISTQTTQELQANIEAEMMPFFMASKDVGAELNSVIASSMGSQISRFAEKYGPEMRAYFPRFMSAMEDEKRNVSAARKEEETIEKMLQKQEQELKFDNEDSDGDTALLERNITLWNPSRKAPEDQVLKKEAPVVRTLLKKDPMARKQEDKKSTFDQQARETRVEEVQPQPSTNELEGQEKSLEADEAVLDEASCLELSKKYPYLELDCKRGGSEGVSSFLQTAENSRAEAAQAGGAQNINVKLAASQIPYPTVYRLINEMQSRRDLAEKWERLKILEFEMNLQKAQDEMIKDALHQGLQKVISKFGPAIEGVQEDLRNV